MKLTGLVTDISIDYKTSKGKVTLLINEKNKLFNEYEKIKDVEKLDIEIKKHRKKRSLDANAYYWSLINQLANVLNLGKEELHYKLIKEYSQMMLVPLMPEQNPNGFFKYYEMFKETTIGDKEAIYYKVYKPSSEMNSKEFWILLQGLESECKTQGIQTLEEKKLEELMKEFEMRGAKRT